MCGPHRPLSDAVAKDYETRGVRLTAVYSNCSGKHTGMLALAKHHGAVLPLHIFAGRAQMTLRVASDQEFIDRDGNPFPRMHALADN